MEIYLETERLVLRRFTTEDVDLLVDLDCDPAVMLAITGGIPTPRAEIENDTLPAFLAYYDRGPHWGFWAAVERDTAEFLGWFHLRPAPGHPADEPELGYRLRRSSWGMGFATEGSAALIAKAFNDCGAARVLAETMFSHAASRRVMEKCGMTLNRRFRQDWPFPIPGDEHGDVEYVITRTQWENSHHVGPVS